MSEAFPSAGSRRMLRVDLVKVGELPDADVEGHDPCGRGLVIIYPPGTHRLGLLPLPLAMTSGQALTFCLLSYL